MPVEESLSENRSILVTWPTGNCSLNPRVRGYVKKDSVTWLRHLLKQPPNKKILYGISSPSYFSSAAPLFGIALIITQKRLRGVILYSSFRSLIEGYCQKRKNHVVSPYCRGGPVGIVLISKD